MGTRHDWLLDALYLLVFDRHVRGVPCWTPAPGRHDGAEKSRIDRLTSFLSAAPRRRLFVHHVGHRIQAAWTPGLAVNGPPEIHRQAAHPRRALRTQRAVSSPARCVGVRSRSAIHTVLLLADPFTIRASGPHHARRSVVV